ncbi:LacI family DNA-binding transcriptional regulator [Mediterraneibacter agrestimuris]|uniref:LacI family DNA-binding transcriptional regulator n=1 Tax=Mediterraneibacter agrestimuris TaxID=2941333 RepID=UPI00203BDA49|nr:LacI family DNA-binding transcriptional regulator [Mediterraneibacter agrestimuris]
MTITEIAKMAEVSVSAVSRYLNDGYVSEEKVQRIKAVIEKTGYRPSKQAQSMRTKKSKVIGVILPKISSESIARVAAGISEVLSESGYQMLLANTENNPKKEMEYLQLLNNNPVDGILFSASVFDKAHKEALRKLDVPVVIISQKFEDYACVYHDDYGAARAMIKQLLDSGKRRIGHIGVTLKDEAAGVQRTKAFFDTMEKYEVSVNPQMVMEAPFVMEGGYEAMKHLLNKNPDLDGVFCATDSLAVGAMMYLKEIGKQIPEEIAVTGIGHNRMSRVVTPTLATAHLHYRSSGVEAAKMLVEMIEQENVISKQLMLGYEIIEAESV